jgi:uncharacterized protein
MRQENLEEVVSTLVGHIEELVKEFDIKLIYIFGSYAKGTNNVRSDLDIAIMLENNYDPMIKLNLIGELTSIFKRDDIDLVILNTEKPVLRHQVIKYGKLVYMKDEDIKVEFEVKVLREYMDMEYFRKTQMQCVKEWVNNKLGG